MTRFRSFIPKSCLHYCQPRSIARAIFPVYIFKPPTMHNSQSIRRAIPAGLFILMALLACAEKSPTPAPPRALTPPTPTDHQLAQAQNLLTKAAYREAADLFRQILAAAHRPTLVARPPSMGRTLPVM